MNRSKRIILCAVFQFCLLYVVCSARSEQNGFFSLAPESAFRANQREAQTIDPIYRRLQTAVAAHKSPSKIATFPGKIAASMSDQHVSESYMAGKDLFTKGSVSELRDHIARTGRSEEISFEGGAFTLCIDPRFDEVLPKGISLKEVIEDIIAITKERDPENWKEILGGLNGKRISLAILDKSPNAFEDHMGNGFMGVNRAVFKAYEKLSPDILKIVLTVGLAHELLHESFEVGDEIEDTLAEESARLTVWLLAKHKIDVRDYLSDLQNLFAPESVFFKALIRVSGVFQIAQDVFSGNEKIFNLYIRYGRDDADRDKTVFITDCHLPDNDIGVFDKTIKEIDHHYDDPALRRETATSLMIRFLERNSDTAPEMLRNYSYVTSHVDPDSMLAYFVLKNWSSIKDNKPVLELVREAACYADFGLLVKKSLPQALARKIQLFTNIMFGIQKEINDERTVAAIKEPQVFEPAVKRHKNLRIEGGALVVKGVMSDDQCNELAELCRQQKDDIRAGNMLALAGLREVSKGKQRELLFAKLCAVLPRVVTTVQSLDDGQAARGLDFSLPEQMPGELSAFRDFIDNRNEELRYTARMVGKEARDAGRVKVTPPGEDGVLTVEIGADGPIVHNANILIVLRREGVITADNEPVLIIQSRVPPKDKPDQGAMYSLSVLPVENADEAPNISALWPRLNAQEPQSHKGWGGRQDGGGPSRMKGSALSIAAVKEELLLTLRSSYLQIARKRLIAAARLSGEPVMRAGDFMGRTYGDALRAMDGELYRKVMGGEKLSPDETVRLAGLVDGRTADAVAAALYGEGTDIGSLAPELQAVVRSPEFRALLISFGLAAENGLVVAYDKRNLFAHDRKTPIPGCEVYLKMFAYFAGYCKEAGKKSQLVVFDCMKDGAPLVNEVIDAALDKAPDVIQVRRASPDVVRDIEAAVKAGVDRWNLIVHQENLGAFREYVGRLLSFLVCRPDGKFVDLGKDEFALIRQIDPAIAERIQSGAVELLPPVSYDSAEFGRAQRAAIAIGMAA